MSFFGFGNKVADTVGRKIQKLPNRFADGGGIVKMGASNHAPRTNTSEEIIDSISLSVKDYEKTPERNLRSFLQEHFDIGLDIDEKMKEFKTDNIYEAVRNLGKRWIHFDNKYQEIDFTKIFDWAMQQKEVFERDAKGLKELLPQLKNMPLRHQNLVHDIIDLDRFHAFINHDIFPTVNLHQLGRDSAGNKTSLLQYIFTMLPKLSKENPEALNLAEKVMTHSDDANGKFFISKFIPCLQGSQGAKQMEATEDLVPILTESYLKGMPSMSLNSDCKENQFFQAIMTLCDKDTKPENIKLLKEATNISDKYKTGANINLAEISKGDTQTIRENIEALPYLLENADAQGIERVDVSGFLTKNVNLD